MFERIRHHDRELAALRRAGRAALVMPAMFALGDVVIGNQTLALFAAFGAFSMLVLVDFAGTIRSRVQAQAGLALACCVLIALGTLVSRSPALAVALMVVIGFGVLFAGVVSSELVGATNVLLLAFVLPVCVPGPVSSIPERLAGWGMSAAVTLPAIALLWPAPVRHPVRRAAIAACRALAGRLRGDPADAESASAALEAVFFATPYRPSGLSTTARTVIRLVDELKWLSTIVAAVAAGPADESVGAAECAAATVLDHAATLLESPHTPPDVLHAAEAELAGRLNELDRAAARRLPVRVAAGDVVVAEPAGAVISALDPGFRARQLCFVVSLIARNIDLAAAAERRSWLEQLLGRRPAGVNGPLSAVQVRAGAHVGWNSLWLQNSVRGAIGLGLAVLVARATGIEHSFWIVLGTLSVLRSNALTTGESVLGAIAGTLAGFVVGSALVAAIGINTVVLWLLLPPAVLLAGLAPATVSFAAGQAAFTLMLLIMFNLLEPAGWGVGLVRIEDVALGCAVSLVVGVLFWPRGAGAALGRALADAYVESARYLAAAVRDGLSRCDHATPAAAPLREALAADAAARRLDDAFRGYLAERGAKPLGLAKTTSLVTGVVGLRLAGDAVLDLWRREDGPCGDRAATAHELLATAQALTGWYGSFAASLTGDGDVPRPLAADAIAGPRLVAAVRHDLHDQNGSATATAVRMIWTGDHLDAARRLQSTLARPARAAAVARP